MKYQELEGGLLKRREQKIFGLFIDGTGLDRATRRINRKVDLSALVKGVSSGLKPVVARYYTLIPYEDDSRQRAFLDAVARAGLSVIVKRLPPKGVTRQVSVDIEMAADIIAFSLGHTKFSNLCEYKVEETGSPMSRDSSCLPSAEPFMQFKKPQKAISRENTKEKESSSIIEPVTLRPANEKKIITVVCPSRDLSYSIALAGELGADTSNADFGHFNNTGDVLKSASKWIDLSDSETIWRD